MSKKSARKRRQARRCDEQKVIRRQQLSNPTAMSRADIRSITHVKTAFSQTHYSGPIPPPELLKQYEEITPGFADRILTMAEQQSEHRRTLESKALGHEHHRSYAGLACGVVVVLTSVVGGCIVAVRDHPTAGATIATGAVVGLAAVFVYGKRSTSKERQAKAELVATGKPNK